MLICNAFDDPSDSTPTKGDGDAPHPKGLADASSWPTQEALECPPTQLALLNAAARAYRIAAAASLAIRTFFDAFSRGILACLDAPMRRLRRRREQTAARGHRRVNSAPLPTHFRVDDLV